MGHHRAPLRPWISSSLIFNFNMSNASKKVLLTGPRFQTKIPSGSRVCVQGERQKYVYTLRTEDKGTLDIKWAWYLTQRNLILGVNSGCSFIFVTLWHFITKCDRYYCKMRQLFYYKMRRLLQNASVHPSHFSDFRSKIEAMFAEIIIKKINWLVSCSYNPHKADIKTHLKALCKNLDLQSSKCENFVIVGDLMQNLEKR